MCMSEDDPSRDERSEVLISMLHIAEGEIKSKDSQIEILNTMIAANERELSNKDGKIGELEQEIVRLRKEMESFKTLFNRYLAKSEAARTARRSDVASPSTKATLPSTDKHAAAGSETGLPPPPPLTAQRAEPADGSAFVGATARGGDNPAPDATCAVRPEVVAAPESERQAGGARGAEHGAAANGG
mmetsp:Transcript_9039/g.26680  ORF Transcript_9039/g.26680 Transcript_9039/m.26680 type:complete len:187 (+) Transcript_9039:123-683(+)